MRAFLLDRPYFQIGLFWLCLFWAWTSISPNFSFEPSKDGLARNIISSSDLVSNEITTFAAQIIKSEQYGRKHTVLRQV